MARSDIARLLNDNPAKITKSIRKLLEYKEINYVEIDRFEAKARYGCKKRMRLYYVGKLKVPKCNRH